MCIGEELPKILMETSLIAHYSLEMICLLNMLYGKIESLCIYQIHNKYKIYLLVMVQVLKRTCTCIFHQARLHTRDSCSRLLPKTSSGGICGCSYLHACTVPGDEGPLQVCCVILAAAPCVLQYFSFM